LFFRILRERERGEGKGGREGGRKGCAFPPFIKQFQNYPQNVYGFTPNSFEFLFKLASSRTRKTKSGEK